MKSASQTPAVRHGEESVQPGAMIVVENLVDIRRLHSWSFAQLQVFLIYKAEAVRCRVVGIDVSFMEGNERTLSTGNRRSSLKAGNPTHLSPL